MANAKEDGARFWVEQRLAALDPPADWEPDPRALDRVLGKPGMAHRPWQGWKWRAATALLAAAALFAFPQTRVAAQRAWQFFFARDVEIVRVDPDNLPPEVRDSLRPRILVKPDREEPVRDREEASRRAGFPVRLVKPLVLSGGPALSVLGPMSAELVVRTRELENALRKSGVTDMGVPREWDGARLGVQTGWLVVADYAGISLMQTRPLVISAPPGFQLPVFAQMVFRILGMSPGQARHFAERVAATPACFLAIPEEDAVTIREVSLRSGAGTLLHDLDDNGQVERTTLMWSTPDRIYVLSGQMADELAIIVANSLE